MEDCEKTLTAQQKEENVVPKKRSPHNASNFARVLVPLQHLILLEMLFFLLEIRKFLSKFPSCYIPQKARVPSTTHAQRNQFGSIEVVLHYIQLRLLPLTT